MTSVPNPAVLAVLGISIAAVLSILHTVAGHLRHESKVHELRVRVQELRRQQADRIRQLAEDAVAANPVTFGGSPAKGPQPPASSRPTLAGATPLPHES